MQIGLPDLLPPLPVVSGKGAAVLSSGGRQASAIARALDGTAQALREHRAELQTAPADERGDPEAAGAEPERGRLLDILT